MWKKLCGTLNSLKERGRNPDNLFFSNPDEDDDAQSWGILITC